MVGEANWCEAVMSLAGQVGDSAGREGGFVKHTFRYDIPTQPPEPKDTGSNPVANAAMA
jgi:hypothetical protein